MVVKLKCIDNVDRFGDVCKYVTIGKFYDCLMSRYFMSFIDDNGMIITTKIDGNYHGKWEVVNE